MEVKDLSWNEVITKRFNHLLLPKSIRGVIIGKSGCSKTTLLLNLLLRPGWLDYNKLKVFWKSLLQPEYRILEKAFEEKLPKEAIICLFPQDLKNINHIYNDRVSQDMPKEEFRKLWKTAWERPHGFVVIDLTSKKHIGKYRSGFHTFYIPDKVDRKWLIEMRYLIKKTWLLLTSPYLRRRSL